MTTFRDVRRSDRARPEEDAREILASAEHGVLATVGAGGWPYAVPMNHVLCGDLLYLHCNSQGHKLDNIAVDERVSYCAVSGATVLPETLTTLYESAVVFGRAAVVTDPVEKRNALESLAVRFCGGVTAAAEEMIHNDAARTTVVRIRIERITGKAHRPPRS